MQYRTRRTRRQSLAGPFGSFFQSQRLRAEELKPALRQIFERGQADRSMQFRHSGLQRRRIHAARRARSSVREALEGHARARLLGLALEIDYQPAGTAARIFRKRPFRGTVRNSEARGARFQRIEQEIFLSLRVGSLAQGNARIAQTVDFAVRKKQILRMLPRKIPICHTADEQRTPDPIGALRRRSSRGRRRRGRPRAESRRFRSHPPRHARIPQAKQVDPGSSRKRPRTRSPPTRNAAPRRDCGPPRLRRGRAGYRGRRDGRAPLPELRTLPAIRRASAVCSSTLPFSNRRRSLPGANPVRRVPAAPRRRARAWLRERRNRTGQNRRYGPIADARAAFRAPIQSSNRSKRLRSDLRGRPPRDASAAAG